MHRWILDNPFGDDGQPDFTAITAFKLEPDHVSLNAPNIQFKRFMTYTRVIPWDWSVHRMLALTRSETQFFGL
jgi:hypothetical protein